MVVGQGWCFIVLEYGSISFTGLTGSRFPFLGKRSRIWAPEKGDDQTAEDPITEVFYIRQVVLPFQTCSAHNLTVIKQRRGRQPLSQPVDHRSVGG